MTAALVSIAPDDLDKPEACPAAQAVANLAALHQLPSLTHLFVVKQSEGRTRIVIALTEDDADQWRAAFGAPAFTPNIGPTTTQHVTDVFWLGCSVRLTYTTI